MNDELRQKIIDAVKAAHSHSMVLCEDPLTGLEPDASEDDIANFVDEDHIAAISSVIEYLTCSI